MPMQYRLYFLKPGQQAPDGSTGWMINDGLLWLGETGTHPEKATLGKHLKTDPVFAEDYDHREATHFEIHSYENQPEVDEEEI